MIAIIMSILSMVCFFIGLGTGIKVGKLMKGETVRVIPEIKNPIERHKEKVEKRELDKLQEELRINLENINNYTGDSTYQKDFN